MIMTASPCPGHATLEDHEAFLDRTAAVVVEAAFLAHPNDPDAATRLALSAVDVTMVPIMVHECGQHPQALYPGTLRSGENASPAELEEILSGVRIAHTSTCPGCGCREGR